MVDMHTKFHEASMNSLGDMLRTKFCDGRTDGRTDRMNAIYPAFLKAR